MEREGEQATNGSTNYPKCSYTRRLHSRGVQESQKEYYDVDYNGRSSAKIQPTWLHGLKSLLVGHMAALQSLASIVCNVHAF